MKNDMTNRQQLNKSILPQSGFSLVELMVAMVVGLILIYGVIEIYVNSKATYRVNEEMSRMQESARFAFDLMVPTVRQAGYTGCVSLNSKTPNDIRKNSTSDFTATTVVAGHEATSSTAWSPALPTGLAVRANSDVVTVQSNASCGGQLTGPMGGGQSGSAQLKIGPNNTCNFQAGDVAFVSDCKSSDIFHVTGTSNITAGSPWLNIAHGGNLNTAPPHLSKNYQDDAEVFKPTSTSYYIGTGTGNLPALFNRDNLSDVSSELVEGVENMQILYGVDTDPTADGVVDQYIKANAISTAVPPVIPGWDRVIAVRISLLMRSVSEVATTSSSYTFDGVSYPPAGGDRFLRQEYTSTVQLRNRSLLP